MDAHSDIEPITQRFAKIGYPVEQVTQYPTATLCRLYKVDTARQNFGVKVYPKLYSEIELAAEIAFAEALSKAGLDVMRYDDTFGILKLPAGQTAAAYTWVEGEIRSTYEKGDLKSLAALVAKVHEASGLVHNERQDSWLWSDARLYLKRLNLEPPFLDAFENLILPGRPWALTEPLVMCHGDYGICNVVWQGVSQNPILIDFTNSIWAPREWDLACLCADAFLRSQESDIVERAMAHYSALSKSLDRARLLEYVPISLCQRAVFLAYVKQGEERRMLLNRVFVTLNKKDRRHRHPVL